MEYEQVTSEQALLIINDHLGEEVRVSIEVEAGSFGFEVLEVTGELARIDTEQGVGTMDPDERDYMASAYMIGAHSIHLGFLRGPITSDADGLAFHFANNVLLAIAWLGIEE